MKRNTVILKGLRGGSIVSLLVGGQYFLVLIFQIILARILEPSDFGIYAFVSMIALFFNNFVNIHGDKYLIKEDKISQDKINNVFTIEMFLAFLFFIIIFFLTPTLMAILDKEDMTLFVQFLCLSFFYNPLSKMKALYERELSFYKAYSPLVIANFFAGVIAVLLSLNDYGIWSLLWWKICILFFEVIILWHISSYTLNFSFDFDLFKKILEFGKPLILSSVLVYIYAHFDYYIVDLLTNATELGYYWLAFQVSHYFLNFRTAINKVVFPTLSRLTNKIDRYKVFDSMTFIVSFIYLIPAIVILIFGKEIIIFVYGIKWLPAVLPFQIFFVIVLFKAIASNAGPLLHAEGNTIADLKISTFNFIFIIPVVYFGTFHLGILGASLGILTVSLSSVIIAFQFFVKPYTGKNFLYYIHKPIIIVFLLSLSLYLIYGLQFHWSKIIMLMIILTIIIKLYFSSLKILYSQFRNYFK